MAYPVYTRDNGVVVETFDLNTSRYTARKDGAQVVDRPFTAEEQVWADAYIQRLTRTSTADQIRADLAAGIVNLQTASDSAQADIATANTARDNALADKTAAATLKTQADSLASTGSTAEIRSLATAVSQMAAWRGQVDQTIADLQSWRAAVDRNAVTTDTDLTYLARLAAGAL